MYQLFALNLLSTISLLRVHSESLIKTLNDTGPSIKISVESLCLFHILILSPLPQEAASPHLAQPSFGC